MVEVTSSSAAVSPTSLTPVAPAVPPPRLDATARTERATRPAQTFEEAKNQSGRVVEDRVEVRAIQEDEQGRTRRRAEERQLVDVARDRIAEENEAEEAAARDKHTVDFRV
jgi:hypothetical protein